MYIYRQCKRDSIWPIYLRENDLSKLLFVAFVITIVPVCLSRTGTALTTTWSSMMDFRNIELKISSRAVGAIFP